MANGLSSIGSGIGDTLGLSGKSRINPQTGNAEADRFSASLNNADYKKALDPTTGSAMATDQVQNNPILGQLYGQGGQMGKDLSTQNDQTSRLNKLQDQGFNLTPEDRSMYGQMSGDITRQFGQQGNQAAQGLAMRGLGAAPSGAAEATFSGLAGNQNEMLAKAQQNIMQQRHQNTMQQIGQQQQFIGNMMNHNAQMGGQAENAIQGQFGRNAEGIKQQQGALATAAGITNDRNKLNLEGQQAQEATRAPTIGEMFGQGIGASAYKAGKRPGDAPENFMKMVGGGGGGGGGGMGK